MRLTDSIPMFSSSDRIFSFPALELSSIDGHTVFRVDDSKYLFHNGEILSFNPETDLRTFGDRRYVVIDEKRINNTYKIYALDGTYLLWNESFEFRDATPAGFTHDEATGMSIYHPALPPRFFGKSMVKKWTSPFTLGSYESPNWEFNIQVPGGEYYIDRMDDLVTDVKTEIRTDQYGGMHEYKVFDVGSSTNRVHYWPTTLCRHNGTTGEPIISGRFSQIKISTPDQIVYYKTYDSEYRMRRTGCVSLIDSTFKVEPRFADIKVFYDNDMKPYALVRMSSLGEYELYDPSKSYDYSEMSPLETAFENEIWHEVIPQIKPENIEDFQEKNLMTWFKAETEAIKSEIEHKEDKLKRIVTGTLFDHEKEELEKKADGEKVYDSLNKYRRIGPWRPNDYTLEDAFEFFAGKSKSDKAENYTTLAKYVKELISRDEQLYYEIAKAQNEYIASLKESRRQMELAQRMQIYEAMEARRINEAQQQEIMLQVLGAISGIVNQIFTPSSPAPAQQTVSGVQPMPLYGPTMADQSSISPEVTRMAISAGWVPDYSDSGSTSVSSSSSSKSTSHSSSSRVCQSCYGSGKCPHCHGKGSYAPNLNGHIIDCTSCHKTGTCHVCNGTGHH